MKKEEHKLQIAIHKMLLAYRVFHFAVPNGGMRNLRVATALKAEGVLAGVSDLILLYPNRPVFVEIKNGKAGKQSDSQKIFQEQVESLGFQYEIWRSLDDCLSFLRKNMQRNQEVIK